jgi:two-component system NarL family response regulator
MDPTNNNGRIRTMIVEDHFVVRVGLAAIINSQPDMVNVAETGNGRQAVELFEKHQPDVTLMDLRLPGLTGIEAITSILAKFSDARIIVLSSFGGTENVFRAFQAGARSYFLKDVKGRELVDAIGPCMPDSGPFLRRSLPVWRREFPTRNSVRVNWRYSS